jgi:hypothetical protein
MLIRIVTSCTGAKGVTHDRQLTLADFEQGAAHVVARETELEACLTPAVDLYCGLQHQRLLRGLRTVEFNPGSGISTETWIVSAGYGLVPGSRRVAPYEATFIGMSSNQRRAWARQLHLSSDIRSLLAKPADLILILLGDDYLEACELDSNLTLGGPCFLLCASRAARRLPDLQNLHKIELGNPHAKQFSCGLVGLKGELVSRLLEGLASGRITPQELIAADSNVLELLNGNHVAAPPKRGEARPNPTVDQVIEIPSTWLNKTHREKLMYFIPEWDDLVDPDYDFASDTHSGQTGDWSNEVYAHQIYPEPSYDGLLVSRAVAEKSKKKDARINAMGVHRFLRVPRNFPIMGDCGAFDYIDQKEPPYTTEDILAYYTRLDFDYGVSVDHLIVPAFYEDKQFRYDLTIQNAEDFIKEHKKRGLTWEPIGAVQGWDSNSYADAAAVYAKMGYRYLALGGLVRCQTREILAIVEAVRKVIPPEAKIHVFGFSRLNAIRTLVRLGVNSIDSASMLRKAWLGAQLNYLTIDGWYSAIRIPQSEGSFRAKRLKENASVTPEKLTALEQACLKEIRAYAGGRDRVSDAWVLLLHEYDVLVAGDRTGTESTIRRTLEDRPWDQCGCTICQEWGIEVLIFRGNNRNRRRGFHNTYIFYQLLQKIIHGERISWIDGHQLGLSMEETVLA